MLLHLQQLDEIVRELLLLAPNLEETRASFDKFLERHVEKIRQYRTEQAKTAREEFNKIMDVALGKRSKPSVSQTSEPEP